ncbi:unnamed protein product [Cochlearia groenlandica]
MSYLVVVMEISDVVSSVPDVDVNMGWGVWDFHGGDPRLWYPILRGELSTNTGRWNFFDVGDGMISDVDVVDIFVLAKAACRTFRRWDCSFDSWFVIEIL